MYLDKIVAIIERGWQVSGYKFESCYLKYSCIHATLTPGQIIYHTEGIKFNFIRIYIHVLGKQAIQHSPTLINLASLSYQLKVPIKTTIWLQNAYLTVPSSGFNR